MTGPFDRRELMRRLAPANAFQPATMLWRVFEIEAIQQHATLSGRGVDIGCGDGDLGRVVFDGYHPRPQVIGVEPDVHDCTLARESGTYEAVHCVSGDAIPVAAGTLDFVFSNSTLEHIPDLQPVIAEAGRVLRTGGEFVFTVPSEQFHACLRGGGLVALLARRRGRTYSELIDERLAHHRYPSPEAWTDLLGAHGFVNVRSERYFPLAAVRAWESLSNITGGLAFELFGARRPTRQIQHRLGLSRRTASPTAAVVASMTALVARRAFGAAVRASEPSGGLLIVATRG
ncbi:MAG TPA: class I SAM-dependent methyltransferase [Candidatus Limnocylindria bacterium]